MREFKVKVWDIKDKKWMTPSVEDVEESEIRLTIWGDILYRPSLEERIELGDGFVYGNDRFVLMQYTGVDDEENEGVYEGSIIKGNMWCSSEEIVGEVRFNELDIVYEIVINGEFSGILLTDLYDLEVIGNHFEGIVKER